MTTTLDRAPSLGFAPPSADAVIAKVREIAAETPNYIYQSGATGCVYVKDGEGSCILGKALVALGVPLNFFERRTAFGDTINGKGIWRTELQGPLGLEPGPQLAWLQDIQGFQDTGTNWGKAVELADRRHSLP